MSKARDIADLDFNAPDIDGGNIDGAVIGGTTPAAVSGTTGQFATSLNVDGTATVDGLVSSGNAKIGEGVASNSAKLMVNTASGSSAGIQLFQDGIESWVIQNPASTTALTFANSNTERLKIANNGDISFYSSDGSSAKMVWDSSTENLGVGTAPASTAKLHISSGVNNTPTVLRVENTDGTIETNQDVNAIQFYTNDYSAGGTGVTSSITQYALNPGNLYGLSFKTFTGGALYEALKIESSGNAFFTGDINIDGGTGDTSSQDVIQRFERTSSTGNVLAAKLKFVNSDTNHGDLKFQVKTTASSADFDNYYTDALTIKGSTGRIGVGINSPESLLHLYQKGSQDGQLTLSSDLNGSEHNAGRIAWNHSSGWDTTITLGTADNHSASFRDELIINKDYVVFNENSNDMDFRVESNSNANAFFIDAGQNTASFGNTVANPASGFSDQHGMGIHLTDGYVQISADSTPLTLGRTATAGRGEHIIFRNASAQFASIGDYNGVPYFGYTNTNSGGGIMFNGTSVEPTSGGAGRTNGVNDLGSGNYRWRNGMFSGVVQAKTFERNWQFLDMQSLDFNTFYPVALTGGSAHNSSTFELYKFYGNYNPVVNGTTMLGSVTMKMDMSAWSWGGIPVHNLVHHVAHQYRSMLGAVGLKGYYTPVLWLRGGYGYHFTTNSSSITPTIYTSSTSFHTSPYNYNIGPISETTMASKAQYLGTNLITGIVSKSDITHWS